MFFSPNCRIAEYHLNHYESAHAAFTQGHQLDGEYNLFWPRVQTHPALLTTTVHSSALSASVSSLSLSKALNLCLLALGIKYNTV